MGIHARDIEKLNEKHDELTEKLLKAYDDFLKVAHDQGWYTPVTKVHSRFVGLDEYPEIPKSHIIDLDFRFVHKDKIPEETK